MNRNLKRILIGVVLAVGVAVVAAPQQMNRLTGRASGQQQVVIEEPMKDQWRLADMEVSIERLKTAVSECKNKARLARQELEVYRRGTYPPETVKRYEDVARRWEETVSSLERQKEEAEIASRELAVKIVESQTRKSPHYGSAP
jgi:hypothetical protein